MADASTIKRARMDESLSTTTNKMPIRVAMSFRFWRGHWSEGTWPLAKLVLFSNGQVQFQQPFTDPPHFSPLHGSWFKMEPTGMKITFNWQGIEHKARPHEFFPIAGTLAWTAKSTNDYADMQLIPWCENSTVDQIH